MKNYKKMTRTVLFSVLFAGSSAATAASFNMTVNFTGGLTASQQSIFTQAETFWEGIITGYQAGISLTGLSINASGSAIDGVGGTLGQAGPTVGTSQAGYILTTQGVMQFDSADLGYMETNGSLLDVIKHEMAHVIGFGTLWGSGYNNVYDGSGRYTGAAALAAYQTEFDPSATYVPVELGGGPGTAGGHWNEVDGGSALTGITDGSGNDMRNELMTGWLNSPTFISNTTKASFIDLGYTVAGISAPVSSTPIPGAIWLFGSGLGLLGLRRKRKTR